MEKEYALNLSSQIGIDVQQLIREEAELIFLKALFESRISDALVFKGGTALRLIYNSPRFSEDLDFSLTSAVNSRDFKTIINKIIKSDSRFSLKDLASKYYTHLAEIRIKESWQNLAFSLKIEVSKRPEKIKAADFTNLLAKSPATNLMVTTKVYTLEKIFADKLHMLGERKMPRDIFDLWFIAQKTGRSFAKKQFGYQKGRIRQELRKFLPRNFYAVVEELEKLNA
jgi:predicted nucleotidyltransferase component of viral defense system